MKMKSTSLPDEFRGVIKDQLDCLLTYHEQLLLKFLGKMHPHAESEAQQDVCLHRKELMSIMLEEVNSIQRMIISIISTCFIFSLPSLNTMNILSIWKN